jgi:hypothetical protein
MFTSQKTRDGKLTNYGMGWRVFEINETNKRRMVGHGGAQQRVTTNLLMIPDAGVAVAIMCNLEGTNLNALAMKIAEIALEP